MYIDFKVIDKYGSNAERVREMVSSSWISATYGSYSVSVGDQKLFEYSDSYRRFVLKQFPDQVNSKCVIDYIGKFYLSIFRVLPYAMEVIPSDLTHYLYCSNDSQWESARQEWYDEAERRLEPDDPKWELYEDAMEWRYVRRLDLGHLVNAPRIWFWRNKDEISIDWNNKNILFDEESVYTAQIGSELNSINEFVSTYEQFESRLLASVFPSIDTPSSNIRVVSDEELAIALRGQLLETRKNYLIPNVTDWDKVRIGLGEVLKGF
jgi:Family of unknown function (DUF5984)